MTLNKLVKERSPRTGFEPVFTLWFKRAPTNSQTFVISHHDFLQTSETRPFQKFTRLDRISRIYPISVMIRKKVLEQDLDPFSPSNSNLVWIIRWRLTTLRGIDFLQTSETGLVRKFTWLDVMSKIYPYFSDDSSSKWDLNLRNIDPRILILKYNWDEIRHRNLPSFSRDSSSSTNDGHHRDPRSRL